MLRRPIDRIKDFDEIYAPLNINDIKPLISKCMNCSESFCSKNMLVNNVNIGCPLEIDINKIIALLKYDLLDEAYEELTKNNPFPEITERVCKGYCEYSCINCKDNNPVEIKKILRTLADYGLNKASAEKVNILSKKKINIIGSGASGLACANYLIDKGYNVTVYEKEKEVGGTLLYGISNMRLDKKILKKRIDLLKKKGVNFLTDTEVTRVISPMDVLKDSDALVIASGVIKRRFVTKGMGLKNVMYATDYLKKVTNNILDTGKSNILENKSVLILGSGDTTNDVMSYAIRENAKMVATIDYKNMPPLKRTTSWPMPDDSINNNESALEARSKMGMDPRSFNMTIREINGETCVESVKICQVKWIDNKPTLMEHDQIFPIDVVIISIGNIGFEEDLINYFDIDVVNKLVDENHHKNSKNVFICGEALINNGITAFAIKDGIKCAKEVEEYLEA